jgi:hypothetical protein
VRSGEGKKSRELSAAPHPARPSRIVRDELAQEIAQKLGIDSPVLRQELRHVAADALGSDGESFQRRFKPPTPNASSSVPWPPPAKCSRRRTFSARDGAEEEFDPARQAQYVLQSEGLHRGLATESLAETLLNAGAEIADVMEVPQCGERAPHAGLHPVE